MTRVFFVRHAQPVFSHADDRTRPLTEEGKTDRQIVVQTLRNQHISVCWCSPYLRSVDTIREAAEYMGLPIHTDERLREREAGPGGNQVMKADSRTPLRCRWEDHSWHEPGGESIGMVQQRNIEALQEILTAYPDEGILIGTHGTALSSILNYYRPDFGVEDFLRIIDWMPYIVELDFEGQQLMEIRELAHIEKEFRP